jgi:hypothetical protein
LQGSPLRSVTILQESLWWPISKADERKISLPDFSKHTARLLLHWIAVQAAEGLLEDLELPGPEVLLSELADSKATHNTSGRERREPTRNLSKTHKCSELRCKMLEICHQSREWQRNYHSAFREMAKLFVFADKYDVPQLRDDIITAMSRRNQEWTCVPELNVKLVAFIYENLPTTSSLARYIAYTTAVDWLPQCGPGKPSVLETVYNDQPDFALQVGLIQKDWIQCCVTGKTCGKAILTRTYDRCSFHEHIFKDQKQYCQMGVAVGAIAVIAACARYAMDASGRHKTEQRL